MALNCACKLIFLKCIFEFIINAAPLTSNSVHGREKCFKCNNFSVTIIHWLRGAVVKNPTFGESEFESRRSYTLFKLCTFFKFSFYVPFILSVDP